METETSNIENNEKNDNLKEETTTTTSTLQTNNNNNEENNNKNPQYSNFYSLVVFNAPKYADLKKFNKYLQTNNIPFKKTKKIVKENFGVITFETKEERDKYLEFLNGKEWNGSILKCEIKEEKSDRMKRKLDVESSNGGNGGNGGNVDNSNGKLKTIEEVVCPWYNIPYEEQLEKKRKQIENILIQIKNETRKESFHNLPFWLEVRTKTKEEKLCCPLEDIIASPEQQNYRNKAQYTIGLDENGLACVGFALGRTGAGITVVADPSNAPLISKRSNEIRKIFNDYILGSDRKVFDKNAHEGFWRQLTVRDFSTGESMATIQVNHKGLTLEEINQEKEKLKNHFSSLPKEQQLTSLSIQLYDGISNAAPVDLEDEVVLGNDYIHEKLLGYQFRVSSNSFFQVNTKATELLYSKVLEWAGVNENTHLLDVCCGTGTIGQCASKKVKCVTGFEISPDAIKNSIENAKLNNIENCTYVLGKAEATLPSTVSKAVATSPNDEFIGIVDPPRSGLHSDVLKAIRTLEKMDKLVYVSCNQKSLVQDAIKLCKGISKVVKGTPFIPTKAIAFDLFPHTELVELVVLFERYDENADKKRHKEKIDNYLKEKEQKENMEKQEQDSNNKRKRDDFEDINNNNNNNNSDNNNNNNNSDNNNSNNNDSIEENKESKEIKLE